MFLSLRQGNFHISKISPQNDIENQFHMKDFRDILSMFSRNVLERHLFLIDFSYP